MATSSPPRLILSSFDTKPVSRSGPLHRPSPQHAVSDGIGPLSPSSLSSHRSTRLFRPCCFPPTRTSRLAATAQEPTHSGTPVHSHCGPTSDTPVQLPRAGCRPSTYSHMDHTPPRTAITSSFARVPRVYKCAYSNPLDERGVDKARTSPCVGGVPFIKKRRINRPSSSFEPQGEM